MSDDFQNELTVLGIESSPAFVREPEGNGCIERFFRKLKEQLLWVRHFPSILELARTLEEFRALYNQHWLIEHLGFEPPVSCPPTPFTATGRLSTLGLICPRNQGQYSWCDNLVGDGHAETFGGCYLDSQFNSLNLHRLLST